MIKNLLLSSVLFFSVLSVGILASNNSAAAPAPGCYEPSALGDYFVPVDCGDPELQRFLEEKNECVLRDGSGGSESGDCNSSIFEKLDIAKDPDPDNLAPGETHSPEFFDAKIKTDCEEPILNKDNCNIILYLVNGINFMTAAAGMVIVFSIMMSGYQYMTARDNPGWVQQARQRIVWALVALLIMIFMYAILNWLIPGGLLSFSVISGILAL